MDKDTITISINKDITQEEINEIRKIFKNDKQYENYKLNIIVSGNEDMALILGNFLKARLNS